MKTVDVVVIELSSPILIGIYENQTLIETFSSDEYTSEALPILFKKILEKYKLENIIYTKGPGSFMAIKVAYIFLKSMSVLKKIPLFATDAFYFNANTPIKAIGKLHFVKIAQDIKTQKLEIAPDVTFSLPNVLDYNEFSTTSTPLYMISAVGQ